MCDGGRGVILLSHPTELPWPSHPTWRRRDPHRQPTGEEHPLAWSEPVSERAKSRPQAGRPVSHLMPTCLWSPRRKHCPRPETEEGTEAQGP